jgi:hypothetical protein
VHEDYYLKNFGLKLIIKYHFELFEEVLGEEERKDLKIFFQLL